MVVAERCLSMNASGFHLSGRESVSSASLYKQRIDSMFDETRSTISQTQVYGHTRPQQNNASVSARPVRRVPSIPGRLDGPGGLGFTVETKSENPNNGNIRRQGSDRSSQRSESQRRTTGNSVQASIERMFSELAMETDSNDLGTHTFSVDYLGSTPLPRKVTSLAGLQAPLAKLYLAYRRLKPIGTPNNSPELKARLDISKAGLHVRHCGTKGELEQLNPFPTIAVWSAVKFVLQPLEEDPSVIQFAFLPLITDPDNIDKQALFRNLDLSEKKYILGRDGNSHSPLFTVVMRKIGVAKQLECHGFICQTSEDAIVIAATLYKSLMAHMSKVPRAKGGITGPSIASSTAAPVRPPRRKRTSSSASGESDTRASNKNDSSTRPVRQDSFSRNSARSSARAGSHPLSRNNSGRMEVTVEINNNISKDNSPKHEARSARSSNASSREKIKLRRSELPGPPPPPPPPPFKLSGGIEEVKAKLASIRNGNESGSDKEKDSKTPPQSIYKESMDFLNNQLNHLNKNTNEIKIKNTSNKKSKESTTKSKVSEKIEMFSSLEKSKDIPRPLTVPPPVPIKPKKDEIFAKEKILTRSGPLEPLRRSHSLRNTSESGDILTKVAIPRSGSFLNASGLSRYKSTGQRNNGKKGGGSPLGFSELFNEFKVQEDLHSMDDILGAIIDADGMSFNDLKPIYKEFLLKLAVTLTKDELFQHSKNIMRRQKKKLRRNSMVQNKRKKMIIGAKGLKMVFRKPFGKDILKTKLLHMGESKKNKNIKLSPFEMPKIGTLKRNIITSESSISTSSYDLRQFHPKEKTPPKMTPKRQSVRRRNSKRLESTQLIRKTSKKHSKSGRNVERVSTSEDSDFLTLSRKIGACQNRNSSSGYVSCSECESEGCVDRCYCAVRVKPKPEQVTQVGQENCCNAIEKCCDCTAGESSHCYSLCGCDTESCADSDKCYCKNSTIKRQNSANTKSPPRHSKSTSHQAITRIPSITARHCNSSKCPPTRTSQKSPRRRSAPGPATLDSLYYEHLRPKSHSLVNQPPFPFELINKKASRFDTFSHLSCSTELEGKQSTSIRGGRKSYSSDNLHLDYDMFIGNIRAFSNYGTRRGSVQLPVLNHHSKEEEVGALFSDGRLLSARRGLYQGPSAALIDSLGYLP